MSGTELQNKSHTPNIKSSKEKNKKVINAFFTSKFTKRLMVTQGNFSYQGKRHSPEKRQSRLNNTFVSIAQLGVCTLNPLSPERKGNIINYLSRGTDSMLAQGLDHHLHTARNWEWQQASSCKNWDWGGNSKQGLDPM